MRAGWLGLLAAVHVARPELDPSWVPISDFALGRHGWLMNGAFIAWGAATVTAALSVWPRVRGRLARAGLVLVLIGGTGPLVAAAFPADPVSTPMGAATLTGHLHALGPVLADGVPLGGLLLLVAAWRARRSVSFPRALAAATALTWAAAIWVTAAIAVYAPDGGLGPDTPVGWANRAMVLAQLVFAGVLATRGAPTARP